MTVTQASNGTEGIESATASAAAILSQLNEMVQGQQQQNAMNYIAAEVPSSSRTQSEKVILFCFDPRKYLNELLVFRILQMHF